MVKEYSVQEVARLMSAGEVVVVDIREDAERAVQHVPGTVHIPMSEIQDRLDDLPLNTEIVLICRSGNRSANLADMLTSLGDWDEVVNCVGGLIAWADAGLPYTGMRPS